MTDGADTIEINDTASATTGASEEKSETVISVNPIIPKPIFPEDRKVEPSDPRAMSVWMEEMNKPKKEPQAQYSGNKKVFGK